VLAEGNQMRERQEPSSQLRVFDLLSTLELEADVAPRQRAHLRFSEEIHGIFRSSSGIDACVRSFGCRLYRSRH
jgi:hypothetical protein